METRGEWEFIRDYQFRIPTKDEMEWHIGLMEDNGTWTWVSGTKLKTADCKEKVKGCWPWPWHQNEPSDFPNEKVAIMYKDYQNEKGLFNNIAWNSKKGFICEITKGEY